MFTAIWGTIAHDYLLMVASEYPMEPSQDRQLAMTQFLQIFFAHLPCGKCGQHALQYLAKNPATVGSRTDLIHYLVAFHNYVNRRMKKKSNWTVEEAQASLDRRYKGDLSELARSEQKRQEDHDTIAKLEAKIQELQLKEKGQSKETQENLEKVTPSHVENVSSSSSFTYLPGKDGKNR